MTHIPERREETEFLEAQAEILCGLLRGKLVRLTLVEVVVEPVMTGQTVE